MTASVGTINKMSSNDLQDLVIESDSGARKPQGISVYIMLFAALSWSLFQLWISSPLPYTDFAKLLNIPIFNSTDARFVHLSFALFLAFMSYPATKKSPRHMIPILDWTFAILGVTSVLYLLIFKDDLATRAGSTTNFDIIVALLGIVLLLESARRALGPPLVIIALIFLIYTFAGNMSFIPDVLAHKGQPLYKIASHQWLGTEGVFGIAIGVSTDFVFLFVLFGALLDRAGAGNYFIKLAFSLLGHLRGGPAKAAVLSSAMTGVISGSSIANVVTTGTFTVPLMRKVGFSREKAGAVEVASSVNGQIMPPVMGAAAFLMVEYVDAPYTEIVKSAFIPAVISYIALIYMVHLEALKANMKPIPKNNVGRSIYHTLLSAGIIISSLCILAFITFHGINFVKSFFNQTYSTIIIFGSILSSYIALIYYAAKHPPLEADNPNAKIIKLPDTKSTVRTGLHYILPIIVLVWCLMVERLSPGLSAFWATIFMIFILLTQNILLTFFRQINSLNFGEFDNLGDAFRKSSIDLFDGLVTGARNMVGIAIATAAAGIIVGSVTLTGVGQVMTEFVEVISGGSFILVLIFTALICLILGMGLPTTANYIVVSSLMAGVIVEFAKQHGMEVPLIAVHLFVFYFGIMADVTPPVGLASFAAAAVSGGDPIRTGIQAFIYSIRTVILPFIFIYNSELLLIGVDNWFVAFLIFLKATIAILIFAAAAQGFWLVKNKVRETLLLLLIAFSLFRPGYWVNMITPEYKAHDGIKFAEFIDKAKTDDVLRVQVSGMDMDGENTSFKFFFPIKDENIPAAKQIENFGLTLIQNDDILVVDNVAFASDAEKANLSFDFTIDNVETKQTQMSDLWIYLISSLALIYVYFCQRYRRSEIISTDKKRS